MKQIENQLTSSRKVGMRDINALLQSAPISRIKTLRDDEGRRGFTLIELLVVVLIIGILAAVALPQYQKAVRRAQGREALTAADAVNKAATAYYLEHGTYVGIDNSILDIKVPDLKHFRYLQSGCDYTNGHSSFYMNYPQDSRLDNEFSMNIIIEPNWVHLFVSQTQGKPNKIWCLTRSHVKPNCADYFNCQDPGGGCWLN